MDKPEKLKRGFWKWLEQKVLGLQRIWGKWPLWLRLLLAAVVIELSSYCSPQCQIGQVRVCMCNLAHGTAWAICMIGGPVYALAAFFGLALSAADSGLLINGAFLVIVAALAAVVNAGASYCANRYGFRMDRVANFGQLLAFVGLFIVLPVLCISVGFLLYLTYGGVQLALPPCPLLNRMVLQGLMSILLGDLVALILFQALHELNEIKVYIFVRSLLFVSLSLVFMSTLYSAQSKAEARGEGERVRAQASNIVSVLEHQISLQMRSIRDLEYLAVASWYNIADEEVIKEHFLATVTKDSPWSYIDVFLLDSPLASDRGAASGRQRGGSTGDAPSDNGGSGDIFRLRLRYDVSPQAAGQPGVVASDQNSLQRVDYGMGEAIPWQSVMGQLLSQVKDTTRGPGSNSPVLYQQGNEILQIFSPCYVRDKLIGVVLVGLPIHEFVARSLERFNISDSGLAVCRFGEMGNIASLQRPLYERNFDPHALYIAYGDAGLDMGKNAQALRCYVARNPESGMFVSQSSRHFAIYILFLAIVGALANALMNQYILVDERVSRQLEYLDERERYNTNIANDMNDLLVTLDADLRIVSINPAACEALGVPANKALGRNFHNIAHRGHDCLNALNCEMVHCLNDIKEQIANSEISEEKFSRQEAFWLINGEGQTVNYEGRLSVMHRDNGEYNIIIVLTNIDAEVKLRAIQSEYVGKLSHDMRTPLSCIKGTVDMLAMFTSKMVNDQGFTTTGSNMLEVARRNVDKMQTLINDVLLCDSIDNHTLHLEPKPQPVAPIVRAVIAEQSEEATRLNVKLEEDLCEREAVVDELRLRQILQNLLANAIKYSPAGETVKTTCRYDESRQSLLFSVSDNGKGIPRERHSLIFNRYLLGKNETMKKRIGLGLGLTICKGLVSAHGGDIWVDSDVGRGSTFYFTIPVAKADGDTESADAAEQNSPRAEMNESAR